MLDDVKLKKEDASLHETLLDAKELVHIIEQTASHNADVRAIQMLLQDDMEDSERILLKEDLKALNMVRVTAFREARAEKAKKQKVS